MKRPLITGLAAGILTLVVLGGIEAAASSQRNTYCEFCTTKAYGWPFPWRVDYCSCEKSKPEHSVLAWIGNFSVVAGGGLGAFVLVGGWGMMRRRHSHPEAD